MSEDVLPEYEKYTLYQLYDVYFNVDREKYPDRYNAIVIEIRKRYNLAEEVEITNEFMHEIYNNYGGEKMSHSFSPTDCDNYIVLASRWIRLGSAFLDGLVLLIPFTFLIILIGYERYLEMINNFNVINQLVLFLLGQFFYLLINKNLLIKNGQSIGKKLAKIKIVTKEGTLPNFFDIYFLRYFVPALLIYVPFIGIWLSMIDILLIFSNDRRCFHDRIAKTKVVKA